MRINQKVMNKVNKVYKDKVDYETSTLGSNVLGGYSSIKSRLDAMDTSATTKINNNNKLLELDFINISKLNSRYNAMAKSTQYSLTQMVFDDLKDTSNIDSSLSSAGLTYEPNYLGSANKVIVTKEIDTLTNSQNIIVYAEESTALVDNSFEFPFDPYTTSRLYNSSKKFPLEGITFEFRMVAMAPFYGGTSSGGIICYAIGAFSVEFLVELTAGGELGIRRNNSTKSTTSGLNLNDGYLHHVSVTIDTTGIVNVYVDGELKSEITLSNGGGTLTDNGYLVFGQIQTSLGGGYSTSNSLRNTIISEIRIWDRVRTQGEIVGLLNQKLFDNRETINGREFVNMENLMSYYIGGTENEVLGDGSVIYYDYGFSNERLFAPASIYLGNEASYLMSNYIDNLFEYSISKNNGTSWQSITPGVLTSVSSISGTKVRLKIIIPSNVSRTLNCYSIGWT